jgi:pimeloyl-ACP methyl ester carboxylesterase
MASSGPTTRIGGVGTPTVQHTSGVARSSANRSSALAYAEQVVQLADVNGIALEYEVMGTGAPVVFIHGAFIADSFAPLVRQQALISGYRLITYHRRGYVGSTRTAGPLSASQHAADCSGLLRCLGVQQAHIVGHSFGGAIALQLTRDAPELVHSLVLLEPALMVGESAAAYRSSLSQSAERYRQTGAAGVLDDFFRARWPAYSRGALEYVLPGGFAQATADAGTTFELDLGLLNWNFGETEARLIRQPALVVLGGGSQALHPRFGETYRLLLDWLPRAEGFVVPAATHFLQLESPEASASLAEELATFFDRYPLSQ